VKIPKDAGARFQFFQDLIVRCNSSRESRRQFYKTMRAYYLFGTQEYGLSNGPRYNKIYPHIDQLSSFMFSPETTKFTLKLGPSANASEEDKIIPMLDLVHGQWHDTGIDQQVRNAIRWAACYGSMFLKVRWKNWDRKKPGGEHDAGGECQSFLVEPHNIGVLREDKPRLTLQEAFCETYYITKSQLETELKAGCHARASELIDIAQAGHSEDVGTNAGPIDRLIVTNITGGSITGNASLWATPLQSMYKPVTTEELIEMQELYVYDDEVSDYRVVTFMQPSEVVWDRPLGQIYVDSTLPYVEFALNPAYDYFWAHSETEKLIPLQDMRNERIEDIRHLLRLQAHPPASVTGAMSGIPDEMQLALDTPSGILALDGASSQIKVEQPQVPPDIWRDIAAIDDMFNEMSGLPSVNQGRGAPGVRSEGHAQLLSQLGSTRAKDRALVVEDSLDEVATLIVKLLRKYDKSELREGGKVGQQFMPAQFPSDFEAKVDGHSNSPIFTESLEARVFALLDRKVIDRDEALDLLDIPMRDLLKKRLREVIEPAEAAAAKAQQELELAKHAGKGNGSAKVS
jgi:hypothetical protein